MHVVAIFQGLSYWGPKGFAYQGVVADRSKCYLCHPLTVDVCWYHEVLFIFSVGSNCTCQNRHQKVGQSFLHMAFEIPFIDCMAPTHHICCIPPTPLALIQPLRAQITPGAVNVFRAHYRNQRPHDLNHVATKCHMESGTTDTSR